MRQPKPKLEFQKRYIREYVKVISKQTGVPEDIVKRLVTNYWRNVHVAVTRGDDVRIKGFGRIFWDKQPPMKPKPKDENDPQPG